MTSKENNKGFKFIIEIAGLALFCAAVAVAAVLLVKDIRSKSVDLNDYITVAYSGANGEGEANYTFDMERFEADWEEKLAASYEKLLSEAKAAEEKAQKQVDKYKAKHPGGNVPSSVANPLADAQALVKNYEGLINGNKCAATFAEKYLNLSLTTKALKEAKDEEEEEEENASRETEIGEDIESEDEAETTETESEKETETQESKESEEAESESAESQEEVADTEATDAEATDAAEAETQTSNTTTSKKKNQATETAPNTKLKKLSNGDKLILEMRGEWIAKKKAYQCDENPKEVMKTIKSIFGLWVNYNENYTVSGLK